MKFKSFAILTFFALFTIFGTSAAFAQEAPKSEPANSEAPLPTNAAPIKIGIALPKASFAVEGVDNAQIAAGIREMIGGYFKGTGVEIVALEARLPQTLLDEAKEKGCFYILQTAVTQKKSGGGFGAFKSIAPVLGSVAPMAGISGSTAGMIAGSVAQTAIYTAANLAENTKAKDQFTFEYSLVSAENRTVKATNSVKAKAKADGEDVLSPIVEKMAEAVLKAVE
jgi:hypothetical protein